MDPALPMDQTLQCKPWCSPAAEPLFPQVALCCTQIWWTAEVGMAFSRMKEGYEKAMREYHKKQVAQLNTLVTMLLGQLSQGDRQKVMTVCTIDVHARDVVAKMIAQKVGVPSPAWAGLALKGRSRSDRAGTGTGIVPGSAGLMWP